MPSVTIEKRGEVAIIWLDQPDEKINKVSIEFMEEVDEMFRNLEHDASVKAAVLISKKKDFIAGADIEMFKRVKQKGDFQPVTRKGHESLFKLERSPKPV